MLFGSILAATTGLARLFQRKRRLESPADVGSPCSEHENDCFLASVYGGIHAQVCVLDREGHILQANQRWQEFAREIDDPRLGEVGGSFFALCQSAASYYDQGAINGLLAGLRAIADGEKTQLETSYPVVQERELRQFQIQAYACDNGSQRRIVLLQHRVNEEGIAQQLRLAKRQAETMASALEASQQSLELAVHGGNLGLWHWDIGTGYFELNRDWYLSLGLPDAGLDADIASFRELLHPEDKVLWTSVDAASLCEGEPYDRQFRLKNADGIYVWVQALGSSNALLEDGSPESISGILIDINDRKRAELHDSGMAKVIEESLNEVYLIDCETFHFIEVNRGARENLGYTIDELRGMTPIDIVPQYNPDALTAITAPLREGKTDRLDLEDVHLRADGTTYPTLVTLQLSELVGRKILVAIGIDLTQRHELEQQLAQAQKLESIGQLAAGVAHEMNTPLQCVGNNIKFLDQCAGRLFEVLEACEKAVTPGESVESREANLAVVVSLMQHPAYHRIREELPKAIDESTDGVQRVLDIIRAMKEFSHPGDQGRVSTDLNHALRSTTTVTKNRWKEHARLELELDPHLPKVQCDPGPINQVFVNLLVNAADAIVQRMEGVPDSDFGTITIRTRQEWDSVVIEVEDNGCGMNEEVARRVFDPFYTTKEVGQGTGQGLALSHAIVTQKHSGQITVRSTPGVGSLFRVALPIANVEDLVEVTTDAQALIATV